MVVGGTQQLELLQACALGVCSIEADGERWDTENVMRCSSATPQVSMAEYMESMNGKPQRSGHNQVPDHLIIGNLSPLQYAHGALSPIDESGNEEQWVKVEVTVDNGACDTVMPASMCQGIYIMPSLASMRGMEYEVANGATIPNLGERKCEIITHGSMKMKPITFQVADIHKPLLSISRAADMGYECQLSKNGGWLSNKESGDAIPLIRKGNLYVFECWLKQAPFPRQGS